MKKELVIVESPAKAGTIKKYLGPGFDVKASVGHVKDLPEKSLGVDVENGFAPEYHVMKGKEKVLAEIRKAAAKADRIYLAPDPDREGEAIAYHLAEEIGQPAKTFRITFNEITKKAVLKAIESPRAIDGHLFEAQQARRILDRLVGYKISPLLGRTLQWGLSAGRVQSVAVRLIVEREREIRAFVPEEYWTIEVEGLGPLPPNFWMKVAKVGGHKAALANEADASAVVARLENAAFRVSNVVRKETRRNPSPPFITSTLQQEAARKLYFNAKRTMSVAQGLYEGVDIGGETVGLITYMRTDSVRLSGDSVAAARDYIRSQYGADYVPESPRFFKTKGAAQDAHEAIRPTDLGLPPDKAARFLSEEQLKLYTLIWNRFLACQMNPAIFDSTRVEVEAADCLLVATGQVMKFPGFLAVYEEGRDEKAAGKSQDEDAEDGGKDDSRLPELNVGDAIKRLSTKPEQHFTQPPPRFTEATLVKELEAQGIGRPSTYASIISVIQDKAYVQKEKSAFHATSLGELVTDVLVENFPEILNVKFTAQMEEKLDNVESGEVDWVDLLRGFNGPFEIALKAAEVHIKKQKLEGIKTDVRCPDCAGPMVIKTGRNGRYLNCTKCQRKNEFKMGPEGEIVVEHAPATESMPDCPKCSAAMALKRSKQGWFFACSRYPECDGVMDAAIGEGNVARAIRQVEMAAPVECPDCGKPMKLSKSKNGFFFGCTGYPDCRGTRDAVVDENRVAHVRERNAAPPPGAAGPMPERKCEACGSPMAVKTGRFGPFWSCTAYPKCKTIVNIKKNDPDYAAAVAAAPAKPKSKAIKTEEKCEKCGSPMMLRVGKRGPWLGCSGFPKCRSIAKVESAELKELAKGLVAE